MLNKIAIAARYIELGFSIIPLQPNSKRPHNRLLPVRINNQGELSPSWKEYQQRPATSSEINRWFRVDPNAGIALLTGEISGCVALDIDGSQGWKFVDQQEILPFTPIAQTSRGNHVLFAYPDFKVYNSVKPSPDLDIRGDGGYICVWPTVHPSGWQYTWNIPPSEPFAPLPNWLRILLEKDKTIVNKPMSNPAPVRSSNYGMAALRNEANEVANTTANRNDRLYRAALKMGSLVASNRLDQSDVIHYLLIAATQNGLTADDGEYHSRATIMSGLNKGMESPREKHTEA